MKEDFLALFMGNGLRARVLRALILNENEVFTADAAARRVKTSKEAARRELTALTKMDIIRKSRVAASDKDAKGRLVTHDVWFLNPRFKYLRAVSVFVREISPMRYEHVLGALKKSGRLSTVILSGSFMGDMTRPADIVLAADSINERRLAGAVKALEPVFGRELRYAAFSTPEFRYRLTVQDRLIRDTLDFPHLVLMDKSRML